MSPAPLPSSRAFITNLFAALNEVSTTPANSEDAEAPHVNNTNTLRDAPEAVKRQLLALHVAFPNELMPALDLLDRSLVTRFLIHRGNDGSTDTAASRETHGEHPEAVATTIPQEAPAPAPAPAPHPTNPSTSLTAPSNNTTYYVRSAQQRPSRFASSPAADPPTAYEVRLPAWNCSCPAFAFSAFPAAYTPSSAGTLPRPLQEPEREQAHDEGLEEEGGEDHAWSFGAASSGAGMPPVCKHLLACVLAERCPVLFGGFVGERVVGVEEAAGWAAGWGD